MTRNASCVDPFKEIFTKRLSSAIKYDSLNKSKVLTLRFAQNYRSP